VTPKRDQKSPRNIKEDFFDETIIRFTLFFNRGSLKPNIYAHCHFLVIGLNGIMNAFPSWYDKINRFLYIAPV